MEEYVLSLTDPAGGGGGGGGGCIRCIPYEPCLLMAYLAACECHLLALPYLCLGIRVAAGRAVV